MPASKEQTHDSFTLEIIRSYLISTVREMGEATKRSAYSTVISEAEDFTCGLMDADGNMIAQVDGIPLHAGSLPAGVAAIQDAYDDFAEGDVFIVNDPYIVGLHQADVLIARPIFYESELFAFAVNRAHWLDVGGMAAGGWAGTATHVVQEALRIPPIRIMRSGEVEAQVRALILSNVRPPAADWGDLQSQVASTIVAERRLHALLARYGKETVDAGIRSALEYSRTRFLKALEQMPDGTWEGDEVFEDDGQGGGPHFLRMTLTKRGPRLTADFTGSDPQVQAPINSTRVTTQVAVLIAALAVLDPGIPVNSGFLEFVEVLTKPGTLAHAEYPAPVFMGPAEPINKCYEATLKAFAQALPDRVMAGSYQTGNNVTGSGVHEGQPYQWFMFGPGGLGARPNKDGSNVEWHCTANCRNESMELWEHRYPVRFEEYSLIPDSGGRGEHRGGLGHRRRLRMLSPTLISSTADRQEVGPWGMEEGEPGRPNRYSVVTARGEALSVKERFGIPSNSKFANLPLEMNEQFVVESAGGGGFGTPARRDPDALKRDQEYGYITVEGWIRGREPTDLATRSEKGPASDRSQ